MGRERERERNLLHLLVHSPNSNNSRSLADIQEQHLGLPTLWQGIKYASIIHCLPRYVSRELVWKQNSET